MICPSTGPLLQGRGSWCGNEKGRTRGGSAWHARRLSLVPLLSPAFPGDAAGAPRDVRILRFCSHRGLPARPESRRTTLPLRLQSVAKPNRL
jgi:hypothetical protein